MKHRVHSALGGAVVAFASTMLLGSGTAAADPDVVGKRYSEAKSMLGQASLTPIVATVIGDRLPQDDCYVVSTSRRASMDTSGVSPGNEVNVNLSCYAKPATAKGPGFSAGNFALDAEAVRNTSDQETKQWKQTDEGQKWCAAAAVEHPEWGVIADCQAPTDS